MLTKLHEATIQEKTLRLLIEYQSLKTGEVLEHDQ